MKRIVISLLSTTFAFAAFAAPASEAQVPGSAGPKAVAESIHNARTHGGVQAPQQQAQTAGSEAAKAVAESIHLRLKHGTINDSADQRMMKDASRL